jgi:hypothetical protein
MSLPCAEMHDLVKRPLLLLNINHHCNVSKLNETSQNQISWGAAERHAKLHGKFL